MAFSTQEKSSLPNAEPWLDQAELCAKCGKCRAVCPVFRETRDEVFVARGRLALINAVQEGDLSADSNKFAESLSTCIGCYRCVYECPSSIEVVDAVHGARGLWASPRGIGRMVTVMLRHVVPCRRLYDATMRIAAVSQKLLPHSDRGPMRHLPLLLMDGRRVPELAPQSFLRAVRGKEFVAPDATREVVFFVGCMVNYVYPHIGHALVRVLNRHGVSVVIPQGQLCCGTPALTIGDQKAAGKLFSKNAEALLGTGVTDIVCACASGSRTLKHEFLSSLDERDRARVRVYDVTEYIRLIAPSLEGRLDTTVTYHDPCHLRWGQDISDAPRELLRSVCDYHEMADAEQCCGFGGTFNLFHYDMSQQVAGRKAEAIAATDAGVVATACPGCMLQLQTIVAERGLDRDVRHIVELLDEAEGRPGD